MENKLNKTGIYIIALLFLLASVVFLIVGILCLVPVQNEPGLTVASQIWLNYIINLPIVGVYLDKLSSFVLPNIQIIGIIALIVGIIIIIDSIGLFKLKRWAYSIALLISIVAIALIIGIIFVWYLLKPETKIIFDKK
ncbi:MAG: DUF2127 domain-containing protein [Candidatus Helarchaeota archaeon]